MSSPHLLLFVFEKFLFFTYTLIASRDTVTVKGAEKNMDCFDFNVPETLNNILRTIF